MDPTKTLDRRRTQHLVDVPLFALLFLGFFQLLTDFVAGMYAFGLLRLSVPPQIACVVLFAAPVTLLLFRRVTRRWVLLTGGLMMLSRAASLILDTPGRMLAAGVGTASFLIGFPALLWLAGREQAPHTGSRLGVALALGSLLHSLLHTLGRGTDITRLDDGRHAGGVLVLVTAVLLWRWGRHLAGLPPAEPTAAPRAGTWRTLFLGIGLLGVLGLLYFGLATPGVMACWTNGNPVGITVATTGSLAVVLALALGPAGQTRRLASGVVIAWNLLFLGAWSLALWSSRIPFPADPGAYPLAEPPMDLLGRGSLLAAALLSPILYLDAARFIRALTGAVPSIRVLGCSFLAGSLVLLALVLAQVFTTTYDYIPGIGPWFRDRFWLVMTVAGAVATLPVLLVCRRADAPEPRGKLAVAAPVVATAIVLAAGTAGVAVLDRPRPGLAAAEQPLRVMTFNLQQGYSAQGARNGFGQLEAIRRMNPDLVGLQETDTARVAGGNSDLVRFLAAGLGYHACPGPRAGAGTFGIALLSRYPLARARTSYLDSKGEQIAVIEADLILGETTYSIGVTHLGNGGPVLEQRQVLSLVEGKPHAILMGDFNFRPGTESYRLTTARLEDAWLGAGERQLDPPHLEVDRRIDHVFVTPDLRVQRVAYQDYGESDHPAVVVDLARRASDLTKSAIP
ncbi:MAG TPA: endonuclease/exonuclease/phosphatase family protein [Verrucomicrobiota bacterium]|nr:endonuclease/exonuclease/phosphatase family protein [Verrucomicrobiota bacterium]HNU49464.1 endonuclease/exonuclease/phosphatase family protein [Verrucomicrobiota bacterium]